MITVAAALSFAATALPSFAATPLMQDQDHRDADHHDGHPEYVKNRYYKVGNEEGYKDHLKNQQRPDSEHNHKYRNDDDRKAHDYGYQQGWQGQHYTNPR